MAERTVNARQLAVLTWINDGCPDGVMTGTTHKTTAVALQSRRLVTVTKKRGSWRAETTDAGRYFLQYGVYPDGHWTTAIGLTSQPQTTVRPRITGRSSQGVTTKRPVDQLIADVLAGGGRLQIEDQEGRVAGLVSSAVRHGKVPDGKLLQITHGRRWGDKIVELVDKPAWMTAVLDPIPVPERLTKPHPAVATLRADTEHRLRFKRETRQRALRLLDAIAKTAAGRGWAVTCPARNRHDYGHLPDLVITVAGHDHKLDVREDTDKVPHTPTANELRNHERWGSSIPKNDSVPSGRLSISIDGGRPVRQASFGDTKTIDLVDRLPILLQEIELRAAASEERRLAQEREAAERRHRWEQVRDDAVLALREHSRATVLADQAHRWRQHRLETEYVAAMADRVAALEGEDRAAAQEWLDWAMQHLRGGSNPLDEQLRMPEDPEPTADAIKPFMRGLSPHGPDAPMFWR